MEWIKVNAYINPSLYNMDRIITVLNIYTYIYKYISDIMQ